MAHNVITARSTLAAATRCSWCRPRLPAKDRFLENRKSEAARALRAPEGVEHNVGNANAYPSSFIEVEHLKDGSDAERKAMLDRFVGAWNAHDLDKIMASMTDDCVFWSSSGTHPQGGVFEGREAVAEAFAAIFRSFPDAAWTESRTTLLGSRALWEWTFVGTAADGKTTRLLGVDILEVVEDRVRRKNSFRKTVT